MRVYVMTDMEGVCGVLDSKNWCLSDGRYYEEGRRLLTEEVNAAVDGFLAGGAEEILVADGHGSGGINPEMLHPGAELARNWPAGAPYPFAMDDREFDVAAWIGQHPKAGTVRGHLCHTGSMVVRDRSMNGTSVGEFGALALCAGELGVRAILATGCEAFTHEAKALVPGIETVAVKRGTQAEPGHHLPAEAYRAHNKSAIHLGVHVARERIRAGAKRAIERARDEAFGQVESDPPYKAVTVFRSTATQGPRVQIQEHQDSVIALLNQPAQIKPLPWDPLTLVE